MHLPHCQLAPTFHAMSRLTTEPHTAQSNAAGSPGQGQVLVAVVGHGRSAEIPAFAGLASWKRMIPLADWMSVDLRHAPQSLDRDWVERTLVSALDRRHIRPGKLVLLGEKEAGRLALDLVLDGTIECAGILVVDVPCMPLRVRIVPTLAAIRLIVREGATRVIEQSNLLDDLRGADVDERIMMLPAKDIDFSEATARAAETFLVELVARASHQISERGQLPHV